LTSEKGLAKLNHMVKYFDSLDTTFGALADPTRRAILANLMLGQASISDLARPHRMSLPAVMKHLRVLEQAGLVTQKKSGRTRHCQLAAEPLRDAEQWINQYRVFWQNQFASLDRFLSEEQEKGGHQKWPRRNRSKKQNSK
jgi:DNA-binding transcriptional ArsR family regulator